MDCPPRKRLRELTPSPDRDMDSSPAVPSEDEMFPDEAIANNPATPHNNALTNITARELSPPNSQSQARDQSLGVNSNGKRPLSTGMTASASTIQGEGAGAGAGAGGSHQDADTGYQWSRQEDQPGWEWKNNRAREDEIRSLDSIIDKSHMIRREYSPYTVEGVWSGTFANYVVVRYGDPLDASFVAREPKMKR